MRIAVKVKPGAKTERVEKLGDNSFAVWVKTKPVEGKANAAAVEALAEYFGVSKSRVTLIKGAASRNKVFEIL
jgi:uncharacterized protein YggU (UPF0235/DUF167 family)